MYILYLLTPHRQGGLCNMSLRLNWREHVLLCTYKKSIVNQIVDLSKNVSRFFCIHPFTFDFKLPLSFMLLNLGTYD
jgi:hypothetical protein